MTESITDAVRKYREAWESLRDFRSRTYPQWAKVRVNAPTFRGLGVVQYKGQHDCPLDKVPVLLENGNVWWYHIEDCAPTAEEMPRSLRRTTLETAGIGVA